MFACKRSCTSNGVIWIEEKCDEFISYEEIGKAVADINAEVTAIISSSVAGTVAAASVVGNF